MNHKREGHCSKCREPLIKRTERAVTCPLCRVKARQALKGRPTNWRWLAARWFEAGGVSSSK